ncbi:MAG: hypothetical protein RR101_14965 [Burkholderiaceae bacterium]
MHTLAKVTRVTSSGVYVELPNNPGYSYGPCPATVQTTPGDTVVVVPCDENDPEAMAVVGVTPSQPPPWVTMADVDARLAALGLSQGTGPALAEAKAYAAQQAAQALADSKAYTDASVAPLATAAAMAAGDAATLAAANSYTDGKVAPLATTAALDWSNLLHNARFDALEAPIPAGSVFKVGAQTIALNTQQKVVMDSVVRLGGGMTLDAAGNLVVPRAGWYNVSANVTFSTSTSSARRIIGVAASGTSAGLGTLRGANTVASAQDAANFTTLAVSAQIYADAGQHIYVSAIVGTAWSLEVDQSYKNCLSATWAGA